MVRLSTLLGAVMACLVILAASLIGASPVWAAVGLLLMLSMSVVTAFVRAVHKARRALDRIARS